MVSQPKSPEQIYEIALADIKIGDDNVRVTDRDKDIDQLAASIKARGLLQPVVLQGTPGNPPYTLIVGQRRYRAHDLLNRKTILARFVATADSTEAMIRSLVENMQRVELNHGDAAAAVMKLYNEYGRDEDKVRKVTGLSTRRIRDYIQVESYASSETRRRLKSGDVELADVKRALRAASYDSEKTDRLLKKMREHQLTTYQKKTLAEYGEANPKAPVEKIIKEAEKLRIDYRALMVNIPQHLHNALAQASKAYALEPEEMIVKALSDWLSDQGFVRTKKTKKHG